MDLRTDRRTGSLFLTVRALLCEMAMVHLKMLYFSRKPPCERTEGFLNLIYICLDTYYKLTPGHDKAWVIILKNCLTLPL